MEMIKVRDVKKEFGELGVLKGISFSLHEGEVLSIIGPSGSGKSTLLRCLTQLERIDGGSIEVCDDVMATTDSEAGSLSIAMTCNAITTDHMPSAKIDSVTAAISSRYSRTRKGASTRQPPV